MWLLHFITMKQAATARNPTIARGASLSHKHLEEGPVTIYSEVKKYLMKTYGTQDLIDWIVAKFMKINYLSKTGSIEKTNFFAQMT